MSSCGIYTRYQHPESIMPEGLYRDIEPHDSISLASLSWKELFADSKLQALIEQGLSNNTDLQVAYLKITETEAALSVSRQAFLPFVSLTAQGSLNSLDGDKPTKTYSVAALADWELDIFGKLRNTKEGAKASVESSKACHRAVQTRLIATVADSYYTLLMLDKQLSICHETLHNWTENVRIMNALKTAGGTNESAVAQAEANRLVVESAVLGLQRRIKEVENSLSVLLGMVPQSIDRTSLDEQNFPSELASGIPLQLLNNRPDIQQAEYTLAQFFYETNEARAAFYPGVSLSGSAGWTNNAGGIILNPEQLLLNAIGSLVQPIFNRGTNKAKLKIAKAQQEEALLVFRQSLLNAGAEVNNALSQWQTARQQLLLSDKQINSLQTAVHSTRLMMQHGNTNYLEVLTAQQTLLDAELAVAEYRFDEIQGVISLYHALGGGTH